MCVTVSVIRGENMEAGILVNTCDVIAELPYNAFVTRASINEDNNVLLIERFPLQTWDSIPIQLRRHILPKPSIECKGLFYSTTKY